ncbi:hypothetical protein [Streptomyces sp. NPDC055709]
MAVWIYVAPNLYRDLELVRADSVLRIRQNRGDRVRVSQMNRDAEVSVAEPITISQADEPKLPEHFALDLVVAIEDARAQADRYGRDHAVMAQLTPSRSWAWAMYLVDEIPTSWPHPAK